MELSDRIDALLAALDGAERAAVESVLADGYARVLDLEAEKRRLERRLLALAGSLGSPGAGVQAEVEAGAGAKVDAAIDGALEEAASRIGRLAARLADTTSELGELRGRLAALRRRAGGARAA